MSNEKYLVSNGQIKSEKEVGTAKTNKVRTENFNERIGRLHHVYDGGPKPDHLGNKNIITMENSAEYNRIQPLLPKEKVKRPKPFKNNDPSTYPSNQKKELTTWELMLNDAKNPKDREDRIQAKEVRAVIYEKWKDKDYRKNLGEDELKLIGKHPSQYGYPKSTLPSFAPLPTPVAPKEPEVPLEEQIRVSAERKHQNRIKDLTDKYGNGGVMRIIKDFL